VEDIIIREATLNDFENLQQFLKEYWDENFIFVHNSEYFKYYCVVDNKLLFVLGEGAKSKKIYGICGYVMTNRQEKTDLQLILLRVIENQNKLSSIDLIRYIENNINHRVLSSCGVRQNVTVLYELLGYRTGKLNHYYRLADKDEYKVAIINKKNIIPGKPGNYKLKHITSFVELSNLIDLKKYKNMVPYKDEWCIRHRYYESQIHKYKVYVIDKGNHIYDSLIVMREIEIRGTKICKIVDFVGIDEDIAGLYSFIDDMMKQNGYEYIEFYNLGISKDIMKAAGFVLRSDSDNNIIPRLFEPFVQENKDIYYFANDFDSLHMYCGDADQDRANKL